MISTYRAPFGLSNGHVQTIFSTLFRHIETDFYVRETIQTPDQDFLEIDWVKTRSSKCVILSHGLEGNSKRCYVAGMARYLSQHGFDVCAWNYRGCGGTPNKQLRMYHSGATDDLDTIVQHALMMYAEIYLVGFSMGGNLSLKYLGEEKRSDTIKGCVAFSVPTDLEGSCIELSKRSNTIYMKRFLNKLREKILEKEKQFPTHISSKDYDQIRDFFDFDDRYTAPIHGFNSALDYYKTCSSKSFIPTVQTPTLIVNALNDPFLSDRCYPIKECSENPYVTLEMPKSGGHIGFISRGDVYWSEKRVLEFFS